MIKQNKLKNRLLFGIVFALTFFVIANASAKLAFDNDCPVSAVDNVNFSNGTAVFLPFTYNQSSVTNSNLTIFIGTNTDYFCNSIGANLSDFVANRKVILTPEFINALKTSSCNATFENYTENFRKSGNMLSSSGTVFCGIKNLTFDAKTNPSGISFTYPKKGYGNLTISGTAYNGTNIKKYMIAYLMNNPSLTLSGVVSSFADAIELNVTAACPDASTTTNFFNSGKGNYTTTFQPLLLGINWTAGESLKPSQGVGGIFGWLLDFALGNQTLPIITAANLSTNKVYVCGLIAVENDYSNSTVTTINNATTVDAKSTVNTTLEIKTNASVTNASVELVEYPENPKTAGASGVVELGKYIGISIDSALKNALSSVIIKVYYTDDEVTAAGLTESTLRLYYYNETAASWTKYDTPNGGVNTTGNYVWANTTHFSAWGIFGTAPVIDTGGRRRETETGTTSGGCLIKWDCMPWSKCIDGKQIRTCTDIGTCGSGAVTETRTCVALPLLPSIPTGEPERVPPVAPAPSAVPLIIPWLSIILGIIILGIISWRIIKTKREKKRKRR